MAEEVDVREEMDEEEEEFKKLFRELVRYTRENHSLLVKIFEVLKPRLISIRIQFEVAAQPQGANMNPIQGAVLLTSVGQVATASILGFDQFGNPWTGAMPPVTYSTSDTTGAVVKVVDNGDGTATLTDVANGVTDISASLTSAEGLALTDTETVTVANPVVPPPTPVLSSIKIAFTGGSTPPATAKK